MKKLSITLLILAMLFIAVEGQAATYYVCNSGSACLSGSANTDWATGSDSNACTSRGAPCATINGGIGKMSSGDTVIIGNGTYTGNNNYWNGITPPNGSSLTSPTTIAAENDFQVIVDGGNTAPGNNGPNVGEIENWSYGIIRGIHYQNINGSGIFINGGSYDKIIRCAASDIAGQSFIFASLSNSLMEENECYGLTTYCFSDNNYWGGNSNNVYRDNVVRKDVHFSKTGGNNYASFNIYYAPTNPAWLFNNISVDDQYHEISGATVNLYNSSIFYAANTGGEININGMMSINASGDCFYEDESGTGGSVSNYSCWISPSSSSDFGGGSRGYVLFDSASFTNNIVSGADKSGAPYGIAQYSGTATVKNSILLNNGVGIDGTPSHTYNDLYGNSTNYSGTSAGTGELTSNPQTNGLLYPTRIETGSTLASAGSGGQIGPTILYRIGASATNSVLCGGAVDGMSCAVYGDTNWNQLQNGQSGAATVSLWPFPNEATFKSLACAYNNYGVSGNRGFCTYSGMDGVHNTLTAYIWEYLGNQIPSAVYSGQPAGGGSGGGGSTPASLAAPTGLHVVQ